MIGPGGTFSYRVTVEADLLKQWVGRGHTLRDASRHPGTAGERPIIALEDNQITLISTESDEDRVRNPLFRRWGLCSSVSYEVGLAPAMSLEAGDVLSFHRHGTGDLALTTLRDESLVIALGAVEHLPMGKEIEITADPRLEQLDDLRLALKFDRMKNPEEQIFWIDSDTVDHEELIKQISKATRFDHVIVAFKTNTHESLQDEIVERVRLERNSLSCGYVDSFEDKDAWLDYLKRIPRTRPGDLYLSFKMGDEEIRLSEHEEGLLGEYYIRVARIYRWGCPGELSMLAIVKLTDSLTKEIAINSLKMICQ